MNAYRLAMVDRDGDTTWSTVRMVNFGPGSTGPLFSVYPNPAVDRLHLEFPNAAGKFTIRLLNSRGQLLQTINAIAPTTLDIPTRGLAKGIYFLVVDGDQRSDVRTIIKE